MYDEEPLKPWPHPDSEVLYYRRRVPKDLVELVGRDHVKISLRTKDMHKAQLAYNEIHLKYKEKWNNLRQGYRKLDVLEIATIGGHLYDKITKLALTGKGISLHYFYHLTSMCGKLLKGDLHESEREHFDHDIGRHIDSYLEERGLIVDARTRRAIERQCAEAVVQASALPFYWAGGDFRPDPEAGRFPRHAAIKPVLRAQASFTAYAAASELSPATRKRWSPVFASLVRYVGRDDLALIDADTIAGWLDHLLEGKDAGKGRKPEAVTVRDVYLAAVKAVYGWLVARRKLKENPSRDLKVKVPAGRNRNMREFDDREACLILSASLRVQPDDVSPLHRAARRWVPWLCAYTGSRVNEITQLRAEDVVFDDGVWALRITRDAGRVKDRKPRLIPLHPHVVEQGFLEFVEACAAGPLFYEPDLDPELNPVQREAHNASRYQAVGAHIGSWVRSLGIVGKDVGPSHAWRHRFKTEGRRVGMSEQKLDAIQGHAARTKAENYGRWPASVLLPEILKLAPYTVTDASVSVSPAPVFAYDYGSDRSAAAADRLKRRHLEAA
ncbi:DUF6538 domain-containing protein [Methylobacterium brachythecii]|uniref:Integrase n=1 Tax=Methylobacterium brachythecii TaxID=1176177 RepID=A0A7W6AIF3_9HYPH|nr:DUF6538 domain-containing protein [Methylobacterium brachythecii]MBB3903942.1 integrase [Methylobacterium brachythecii]GLS42689.1 hypothetical protein GCM10007884_06740 [Methylobacterium brachythecii]